MDDLFKLVFMTKLILKVYYKLWAIIIMIATLTLTNHKMPSPSSIYYEVFSGGAVGWLSKYLVIYYRAVYLIFVVLHQPAC